MSNEMIKCEVSLGRDKSTVVHGQSIEEVLKKLRKFHTIDDFEREYFIKKGSLNDEIATGWYVKENAFCLTDEDIDDIKQNAPVYVSAKAVSAIVPMVEAKLKEKNA